MPLTGKRPEIVRDILGHANLDATQNVFARFGWGALEKLTDILYGFPYSSLRRVSKMLDSIFAWLQPVPQRFLLDADG